MDMPAKALPAWFLAVASSTAPLLGSDFDVFLNEIHYNPFGSGADSTLEFVELYNAGPTNVAMGGWRFTKGIIFTFPETAVLLGKSYLIVSPAPEDARQAYDLTQVFGPYSGRLDNGGEIVELVNARGRVVSRVHYDDGKPWPTEADGLGPSLEFSGADNGNELPSHWRASRFLSGTPGRQNSRRENPAVWPAAGRSTLLEEGGEWLTFRGRTEASDPQTQWTAVDFDDKVWESLQGPFGFGDEHGLPLATELNDMWFSYTTLYLRGEFELDAESHSALLSGDKVVRLRITYDDAYVAYLNGMEVGRDNVGVRGTPVPFDGNAGSSRTRTESSSLDSAFENALVGRNVLAIQAVNHGLSSPDFYVGAELVIEDVPFQEPPTEVEALSPGILNEVMPSAGGPGSGYFELYNPRDEELDLGHHYLVSSRAGAVRLPEGTVLPPRTYRVIDDSSAGFEIPMENAAYILLEPDGASLVDYLDVEPVGAENSFGRFPDGNEDTFVFTRPTRGDANDYNFVSPVIISEIHYHPAFVPPTEDCPGRCSDAGQWLELHNRSQQEVDLINWSLTKGIHFEFLEPTPVAPGGYLVVASSVESFQEAHPGVGNVVGNWTRRLSHSSDTINLRDALGNRVDHVRYGDGGPLNDIAPQDDVDDGTFRGSTWPTGADGSGHTVELVHPELENRFGGAWRRSLTPGGTPGAPNSAFDADPPPVIAQVEHRPLVPSSRDEVTITCRVSSISAVVRVEVRWALDAGAGGVSTVPMLDDGLGGDAAPGDGIFAARLPPRTAGSLVRWQIFTGTASGRTSLAPEGPEVPPYSGYAGPFYLYEVNDVAPPPNGAPTYRVLMTLSDREELRNRPVMSDVLLPATLVTGDGAYHVVGLRYRGESSRREPNRSFRINLPPERPFQNIRRLNLNGSNGGIFNSQNVNEITSMDLFRRAGEPYAQEWSVNLHFPGIVFRAFDTRYVRKEQYDDDFLSRTFGGADGGHFYRARSPLGPGGPGGDLEHLGDDPDAYREIYDKRNHEEEGDYSDIVELTRTFDPARTPDEVFADALEELIDPVQWARFFAVFACLSNADGGIWNDSGEDYFLYRIPVDAQRPDAGKWILLGWDVEESLADSGERLFRPELPAIRRFLTHPRFAPLYYQELDELADGVFSRSEMRKRFGHVSVMYPPDDVFDVVDNVDAYVTRRLGYFEENIPSELQAGGVSGGGPGARVIAVGDQWSFFRGRRDPVGEVLGWTRLDYDDSAWETGPSGFGLGDGDDATILADMLNSYTTVYARRSFEVEEPEDVTAITLIMDYDDAYVAYINGVEVARSKSAPPVGWIVFDDTAIASHEAGVEAEFVDVTFAGAALVPGPNVLAVVGLNESLASRDFSLIPALSIATRKAGEGLAGGCGENLYAQGSPLRIRGTTDPVHTRSVTVNGDLAEFSYITSGEGPFGATWEASVELQSGENRLAVSAHDDVEGRGEAVETRELVVSVLTGGFNNATGKLDHDTVWTAAGSPYRLSGNVTVPEGILLTLQPGTVVLGNSEAALVVLGRLVAEGTEDAPVVFRSFSCDRAWGGLVFVDTGTSDQSPVHRLRFCEIEGATTPRGFDGCIAVLNSRVAVEDCRFRNITGNVMDATDSRIEIQRSVFEDVYEGVHCRDSTAVIVDCEFRKMIGDRDAIDFDGDGPERSLVERCLFSDGADDGIDAGATSLDIRDSVFQRFADKAISLEVNGSLGRTTVAGNLIYECGTGLAIKDGATVDEGHHNTIAACREGIRLFAKDEATDGGHGVFHSMIVWNNVTNVLVDGRSSVSFSFSNIVDEDPWPGEANFALEPLFVAPSQGDFSLMSVSPCIGAGLGGSDMGAVPFEGIIFLRGDSNESGRVDISDAITTLSYLFLGRSGPACQDRMDSNDDGRLDLTDGIYLLGHLFLSGNPIPPPFPDPGFDPTEDDLVCR